MNHLPEPTTGQDNHLILGDYQAMPIETVKRQVQALQTLMKDILHDGEHYGTIPGCGDKKTLFQSGAQKICFTFRFRAEHHIKERDLPNQHKIYDAVVDMIHIPSGNIVGQGVGTCSTIESKYRYRHAARICPKCGKEAIIKGKIEYGGGWLCFKAKNGCGQKFTDNDDSIDNQKVGKIENEDPADQYNTCKKMAAKRAYVGATIGSTAASDIFTQEFDDKMAAEDAAIEAELNETGSKNQNLLNEYISKLNSFTDQGAMVAWKTRKLPEIQKALSGQGELFKFNAVFEQRLKELGSVKTKDDYINEINECKSMEELSYWWKLTAPEANKVLKDFLFEKVVVKSWKERKEILANSPKKKEPDMKEPNTENSDAGELAKLNTSINLVGDDVYRSALRSLNIHHDAKPEEFTEQQCSEISIKINEIMDEIMN